MTFLKTVVAAAALTIAGASAQALTVDFTDDFEFGIPGGGSYVDPETGIEFDLTGVNGDPYFDGPNSDGPGGLGVCTVLTAALQCNPSSDDEISGVTQLPDNSLPESLVITMVDSMAISGLTFGSHGPVAGELLFSATGDLGSMVLTTFADVSAMSLFTTSVAVGYAGTDFYVTSVDVVPLPAAGLLLLGGLGGMAALKRRKK